MLLLLLACTGPAPSSPPEGKDSATDSPSDSGTDTVEDSTPTTGDDTAIDTDSGTTPTEPMVADYLFDGTTVPAPLLGLGAQIWPGDATWTAALDPLGARLVRISLNANYGSSAVDLPVDASPSEWDAWFAEHALDASPTFLSDLETSLALTDARGMAWIAHQWEAPPAWETPGGVLRPEHVDDYAAMTGALMGWLADRGVEPRWIELCNEPDGDWNSYVDPTDYDALVVAVRADLDELLAAASSASRALWQRARAALLPASRKPDRSSACIASKSSSSPPAA
jgi:hypothetical protein